MIIRLLPSHIILICKHKKVFLLPDVRCILQYWWMTFTFKDYIFIYSIDLYLILYIASPTNQSTSQSNQSRIHTALIFLSLELKNTKATSFGIPSNTKPKLDIKPKTLVNYMLEIVLNRHNNFSGKNIWAAHIIIYQ